MSTNDSSPLRYENFDPDWYLQQYPDVAASCIDPLEHFKRHGQFEGRLPHQLIAIEIENKLLHGFSEKAAVELMSIFDNIESSLYERSYASWALAKWHIANSRWKDAVPYLQYAYASTQPTYDSLMVTTCLIEALLQNGCHNEASKCLQNALVKFVYHPDLYLCATNILKGASNHKDSELRLKSLNSIFSKYQLNTINTAPLAPLSLDNLQSITTTPQSIDGPRVTVIVPAYNASNHIKAALTGLINQTWSNLEIIVIDDCSTDTTCNIVESFIHVDSRIRLYKRNRNYGAYDARNFALQYATGEYVTNHDSDDWSHPQRIQLQIQFLLMHPKQIGVMTSWVRVHDDLYFPRWRTDVNLIHVSVSTLMIRRSVFSEVGCWDLSRVGADSEFLNRIRSVYGQPSVGSIYPEVPLVFARILPSSLTNNAITHLHSQHGGVRKIYRTLAERWIRREMTKGSAPHVNRLKESLKVPRLLKRHLTETEHHDIIIFADFSTSLHTPELTTLFKLLFQHGISVGIFHWPTYVSWSSFEIDQRYIDQVLDGVCSLVAPLENVATDLLMVLTPSVLSTSLDSTPNVRFERERIVEICELKIQDLLEHRNQEADANLLRASRFFSSDWYLSTYRDVAEVGADAALHYIANGAAEGRSPGPEFDSQRYLSYFPDQTPLSTPPLLHYERIGKRLGIDPSYPVFDGLPLIGDRPVILLCGHASNAELFGAELSLLDILDAYLDIRINVVVTIPSSANEDYTKILRNKSHMVHIIPCELWSIKHKPCQYAIAKFQTVIDTYAPRAVHVNTIMLREPLIAARNSNIMGITHVRESLSHDSALCKQIGLAPEEIIREVQTLADKLITNSKFTYELYFKPRSTYLIKNTFDADRFDFPNHFTPQVINIALISSNLPKKGIYDFVQIALTLESSTPNARFLLIGPHNEHVIALKNNQSMLPGNLKILGYSKSPEDAIRQANIVVSLSHFEETFGRTVLEAMAAARPVVAYNHGALDELISHGQNGYLVPAQDFSAVAESLKRLCQAPDLIVSMGLTGRAKARAHSSIPEMAHELSRILEEIPRID